MNQNNDNMQIVIAGCGPAGLLMAAACSAHGLRTAVVDPAPERLWPNQYGVWVDEIEPLGFEQVLASVWPKAEIWTDRGEAHTLERPYGRVDNATLASLLRKRCLDNGATIIQGSVRGVHHTDTHTIVEVDQGPTMRADLFIDATGQKARWVERPADGPTAYQTAYGILAETTGPQPDPDTMIFMDMRDPGPRRSPVASGPPSFLYAMPIKPGLNFWEETVLVRRPEVPFDILKARLYERLERRGVKVNKVHHVERCFLPMDNPLPNRRQRVLGFGGAASMVHPATGYMLAYAATMAPILASRLVELLGAKVEGAALAAEAWDTLWHKDALRCETLYRFGANTLATFNPAQTRAFFGTFFSLDGEPWRDFVSRRLTPWELTRVMWRVFQNTTPEIRTSLRNAGIDEASSLARAILGMGMETVAPPSPSKLVGWSPAAQLREASQ